MTRDRHEISQLLDRLASGWASGDLSVMTGGFTDDAQLISAQHGRVVTGQAIMCALAMDGGGGPFAHRTSNRYIGIDGTQAAISFYLFGLLHEGDNPAFLFGATVVARLAKGDEGWRFDEIRLQVMWTRGDPRLVAHWVHMPGERGWQRGDPAPVIVSELHAPWRVLPGTAVPIRLEDALPELYARYAFAVDQNDIDLLVTTYTEDIEGGFAPLGKLSSRDAVIGMLKNFRHLAPWWQHFADVVAIEAEGDGLHARMIVGRIIPERPVDETGQTIYGAHYQLRVRREVDGWRICWSDYRPGWFTRDAVPTFDIGNPTA